MQSQEEQPIQKKKCHGNRSDQRFRQRCRKQKMSEEEIEQLVQQRRNVRQRNLTDQGVNNSNSNPVLTTQQIDVSLLNISIQVSKFNNSKIYF